MYYFCCFSFLFSIRFIWLNNLQRVVYIISTVYLHSSIMQTRGSCYSLAFCWASALFGCTTWTHVGCVILITIWVTCLVGVGGGLASAAAGSTSHGCSSILHRTSMCSSSCWAVDAAVSPSFDLSMLSRSFDSNKLIQRVMEAIACRRASRTSSRPSTCTLSNLSSNLVSLRAIKREKKAD